MQQVTFTKVFKAEGSSQRGPWVRWDYKTDDGGRFPHFAPTQEIPLDTAVNVQTSAKGDIKSWELAEGEQQTLTSAPEAATRQPYSGQGHSDDARGKTKAIYAAQMGVALFNSLPPDEQTFDAATQIMDKLVDYAFQS